MHYVYYKTKGEEVRVYFDKDGWETDERDAVAYADEEKQDYYVKINSGGFFYNPIGIYNNLGDNTAFDNRKGKPVFAYRRVGQEAFNLYVSFLKTKNQAYLTNAERIK